MPVTHFCTCLAGEGNKLKVQLKLFQQHWHEVPGVLVWEGQWSHICPAAVRSCCPGTRCCRNEHVLLPELTQTLSRGGWSWSWSCRAECAEVTRIQLCHLPTKTTSSRGRGGKAAARWQGWAVRALILLWVSGHLRKWNTTLRNHLWDRQGQGNTTLCNKHGFPATVASSHIFPSRGEKSRQVQ